MYDTLRHKRLIIAVGLGVAHFRGKVLRYCPQKTATRSNRHTSKNGKCSAKEPQIYHKATILTTFQNRMMCWRCSVGNTELVCNYSPSSFAAVRCVRLSPTALAQSNSVNQKSWVLYLSKGCLCRAQASSLPGHIPASSDWVKSGLIAGFQVGYFDAIDSTLGFFSFGES